MTKSAVQDQVPEAYHKWYYENQIWNTTTFLGVRCLKSVSDLWNYQEIISELKPGLIVEFGAFNGGSALFLSAMARLNRPEAIVLSVDVALSHIDERAREDKAIRFLELSSADASVADEIMALRVDCPGPILCMVDSDHRKAHVLAELELLRRVTSAGDYVIVEDGNINGHPVLPEWGPGPWEALEEYMEKYPADYRRDSVREAKFGWTFAPGGFLIRR